MSKLDHSIEAAKAMPPVATGGLILFGFTLNEWVLLGSGLLIALQIFFLLREKVYLPWRASNGRN